MYNLVSSFFVHAHTHNSSLTDNNFERIQLCTSEASNPLTLSPMRTSTANNKKNTEFPDTTGLLGEHSKMGEKNRSKRRAGLGGAVRHQGATPRRTIRNASDVREYNQLVDSSPCGRHMWP